MKVVRYSMSVLAIILLAAGGTLAQEDEKDVPYVPTPKPVVDKMLEMADVQKGDYVIDLGSGDGRIVIQAARKGADGHGVDIDPSKVSEARNNAERAGVANKVRFLKQDLFLTDVGRASVVTLYLLPSVNVKLRDRLIDQMKPGTKVVSHRFDMDEWEPDRQVTVETDDDSPGFLFDKTATMSLQNKAHEIYFWIIPAQVEGNWAFETENHSFRMNIRQSYQEITVSLQRDGESIEVDKPVLRGDRIRFNAEHQDREYLFNGRVQEGSHIEGFIQLRGNELDERVVPWQAEMQ